MNLYEYILLSQSKNLFEIFKSHRKILKIKAKELNLYIYNQIDHFTEICCSNKKIEEKQKISKNYLIDWVKVKYLIYLFIFKIYYSWL